MDNSNIWRSGVRAVMLFLQSLGTLVILPYPFLFFGFAMAYAGLSERISREGMTFPRGIMIGMLCSLFLYPVIWLLAYALSWKAFQSSRMILALLLTSLPIIHVLAFFILDHYYYLENVRSKD